MSLLHTYVCIYISHGNLLYYHTIHSKIIEQFNKLIARPALHFNRTFGQFTHAVVSLYRSVLLEDYTTAYVCC